MLVENMPVETSSREPEGIDDLHTYVDGGYSVNAFLGRFACPWKILPH